MVQSEKITITNEEEAILYVQKALEKQIGDAPLDLSFENWPVLTIRLEGKGYDSTITAEMAEAIVGIQQALNRSYARIVHNSTNARSLTAAERKSLSFKAKVKEGSSLVEVNLGDYVKETVTALVGKMEPEHIILTVLGLGLLYAGHSAYKSFLTARSADKALQEDTQRSIALSREETARQKILADALKAHPILDDIRQDGEAAHQGILRSVGDAKSITVQSVAVDGEAARKIAATARTESKHVQLNGTYRIRKIDWQQVDEVKLWLTNTENNREFMASLNADGMEPEQIDILKSAEWDRKSLYMSINASELRGEVTVAAIVGVSWPM